MSTKTTTTATITTTTTTTTGPSYGHVGRWMVVGGAAIAKAVRGEGEIVANRALDLPATARLSLSLSPYTCIYWSCQAAGRKWIVSGGGMKCASASVWQTAEREGEREPVNKVRID